MNRSPHTSIDLQTPEEVWSGYLVDYSMLRIFRCPVFAHVNDGKLAPRAVKCIFLGYASSSKGYRIWCPDFNDVIQSRDVTFNENAMLSPRKESVVSPTDIGDQKDASGKVEIEVVISTSQGGGIDNSSREVQAPKSPNQPQVEDDYSIARDRPRREIRRLARYVDSEGLVAYAFTVAVEIPESAEPSTYTKDISCPSSPN